MKPRLVFFAGDVCIQRFDDVFVNEGELVYGEQHRGCRRGTGTSGRQRFDRGVVIIAGIDRVDLNIREFGVELRDVVIDDGGNRAANLDRIVEVNLDRVLGQRAGCAQRGHG